MTFDDYIGKLGQLIDLLEAERAPTLVKNVSDTMALVQARVINERKKPDGSSFGKYSTTPVPFWFFLGKDTKRNNQTAVDELYQKVGYWASYQDWREVNNLVGDELNFSFTGEMWKSMKTVLVTNKEGQSVVGWVFDRPEKDKLMGYHLKRFPDLLDLNAAENTILVQLNQARIDRLIKQVGLQ